MKNKWINSESKKYISKYKKIGISKDLALRIYTTRLLGNEKKLVLHGGGNTSMKTKTTNLFNKKIDVMHIKGSGWNMDNIDYPGLPAVELEPLLKTIYLKKLNDFEMVNLQRKCLIDSHSPNPSVETLLHAFLPHKFVDHTHANSILSLIDQPNDFEICYETFGDTVGIVPYVIPGFQLAKKSFEIFKKNKNILGLILLKHGIFTFGESAQESYERMIDLVTIAERKINKKIKKSYLKNNIRNKNKKNIQINQLLPIIRKHLSFKNSQGEYVKWVLDFNNSKEILFYLNNPELNKFSQKGPVTPDHVIRIKPKPLIIDLQNIQSNLIDNFISKKINKFKYDYKKYLLRNKKYSKKITFLDFNPRLILMPGIGLIGIGRTCKEAKIASDLAVCTADVISKAESFGKFESISEKEIFKIEYWPLEQSKLNAVKRGKLTGNITVISGGCGTIGLAIARKFFQNGSEIVLLENDSKKINSTPDDVKSFAQIIKCDVTSRRSVKKAFNIICKNFGGMDILVSNAGAAWQGDIGDISDNLLKKSFELNFYAHQYLSQESINIFLVQNTRGILLYNISKQSINPGINFGPYGVPKASTLFLMRQYALEYGQYGIQANGINADRIRSGILTNEMINKRSKARGLNKQDYMSGNLLKTEVLAEDVADAFLNLAKSKKTTGNIMTVDGGNMSAILR